MDIRRHTIQLFTYAVAIFGGLALVVSFARFNALNDEFLAANFDSVHGARTLLKAGYLLELAAKDLESAIVDGKRRPTLLAYAADNLALAESYGAEGRDKDPGVRATLGARIQELRSTLIDHQETASAANAAEYAQTLAAIRQLAKDFGSAELERWGTLSSANAALAERMAQLRLFILASVCVFLLIMAALGWSLARTRRTEVDLLRAKAEIEAIQKSTLDASPLGIAYVDATDMKYRTVKMANRQMELIFGYPPEQMVGVTTTSLYADRTIYERMTRSMTPKLTSGEVVRDEVYMQRQNGEPFWCSLSLKAIDPDNLARGIVWTCEDISERKEAEVKLQQAMQKAEAASLAKSEFLANMSHELRTPFAGILGLLDLLQRTELSETQKRYTHLARDSASQMLSIVNDVLDFSKIEAGKLTLDPVDFDLRRFFSTLVDAHKTAALHKGLALRLDFVEPLPACLTGDTVRIRQIVDNLLSNAIKFTTQGGVALRVECTAECTTANKKTATLSIAVSDTGIGLPADMHEQIFQKFTQADSSTTRLFGGSGLGLAICRQLAVLMGGRIGVESSSGKGSRFCLEIDLPLGPPAACAESAAAGHHPQIEMPGTVVLLVDDNATNRSVFSELLSQYGCTVKEAESGEQAIRLAGEIRPDVILMDCQMPVVDGLQATRRIRAAEAPGEHVPIIALTAHATSGDRDSCLEAGMDDYLTKPVAPEILVRRIARWAAKPHLATPPAATPAAARASIAAVPEAEAPTAGGRILLVEDNAAIQEATRRLLEYSGYEVVVAGSGQAALDILEAAPSAGDFDLVLMDCGLPGMDGWETTRRWRQHERDRRLNPTAIIAVTGSDLAETKQNCRDAGMNDLILKPYPASSLITLIAGWLGEKSPGNPAAKERRTG